MYASELAKKMGVNTDTVRHYVRTGLLHPNKNKHNGYHVFTQADQQRLSFILKAKELGFSLRDIGDILNESARGHEPCPLVRELIQTRLQRAQQTLKRLQQQVTRMQDAMNSWENLPDCNPCGHHVCHLIECMGEAHD